MVMDLQEVVGNAVAVERAEAFVASDQLSLGELILKCEAIAAAHEKDEKPPEVFFDFGHFYPTRLMSWRGIYAELALDYQTGSGGMPVGRFLELLRGAVGKTFEGYEGGSFVMGRSTPVWVSNYGESAHTAVLDAKDFGWVVVIVTGWRES